MSAIGRIVVSQKYGMLLEAIADVVDLDDPWQAKVAALKGVAKTHEPWQLALEEFLAWMDEGDEK